MQPVALSATDVTVTIKIVDATDFSPETGVTSASAGLALWYQKGPTGAVTSITEVDLALLTSSHSDGGIKHKSDGLYRLDLPDAAVPTIEHEVTTIGGTVTGMHVLGAWLVGRVVPLAPTTAGRTLDVSADGDSEANVTKWLGTAAATPHTAGYPVVTIKDGTGTGEIDTTSGAVAHVVLVDTTTDLTNAPSSAITYSGPVSLSGDVTVIRGDDYDNDESRSLEWTTSSASTWPTLDGDCVITTTIEQADGSGTTFTGSIVTGTGASKKVRQELTAAQTAALDVGIWRLTVVATLVGSSQRTVTLVDTMCAVRAAAS